MEKHHQHPLSGHWFHQRNQSIGCPSQKERVAHYNHHQSYTRYLVDNMDIFHELFLLANSDTRHSLVTGFNLQEIHGKRTSFFFLALIQTLAIYLFINFLNQKIIVTRSTGAH